jgi:putative protein-disulfide isomerase
MRSPIGLFPDMSRPRLIYVQDALCGWCYGFSPVIRRLEQEYADRIDFEVMSGGMVTGERIAPVASMAHIIQTHGPRLEETTGVRFGEAFRNGLLAEGTAVFSSIKPSVALCVLKDLAPEASVAFAGAIQNAVYSDGLPPDETATYRKLAVDFGLDPDEFERRMGYPHYAMVANQEFAQVAKWGIQGFPSVVLFHNGQGYLIARGYMPYDTLAAGIASILKKSAVA